MAIPEWDSVDCGSYGFNTSRECAFEKREVGIPWNYSNDSQTEKVYSSCIRYDTSEADFSLDLDLHGSNTSSCDAGWVYDNDKSKEKTVEQDFNLVCGLGYRTNLAQSFFFAGTAAGSLAFGLFSDRFGRHRTLVTCTTAIVVSGTALAFSVNIWMFMVLRMITGAFTVGMLQSSFVLANELVGPSKRAIAGTVIWVHFAIGYMALSLLAFYVRNWRHLQLVVSLLPTILLIIYVRTPESPRWLLSKGRIREATKVMRKLGKINGAEIKETFNLDNVKTGMKVEGGRDQGLVKLLRSPRLRLYTLNLMFQFVNIVVYYGISMSTDSLGVNKYTTFAIAGAVEIPACLCVMYPIERWGRRPVYIFFMALCGTAILATGFIPFGIGRAAVAMIGKFAITASFCIIYLRACEIIPTPVRSSAIGTCTLGSDLANILAPMILLLSKIWNPFPPVIFGCFALIGAGTSYFLPETRGKKIPETIEEGENIGWEAAPRIKSHVVNSSKYSDIDSYKAGEEVGDPV
eukprot:XP_011665972.1 PREDICTED: organic cation transporter protein-like [Strongylocentrotus purpuratus]